MVFGILWIMHFLTYASRYVIIAASQTYYFYSTPDKEEEASVTFALKIAYFKHAGSIAFGAFIITIIEIIKFAVSILAKATEKVSESNSCLKCLVCCGNCCMKWLEEVCDYINENGFAY